MAGSFAHLARAADKSRDTMLVPKEGLETPPLEIHTLGAEVLRQPARRIGKVNEQVRELLSEHRGRANRILYFPDFVVGKISRTERRTTRSGGHDGRGQAGGLEEVQAGGGAADCREGHEEDIPTGGPRQERQHFTLGSSLVT